MFHKLEPLTPPPLAKALPKCVPRCLVGDCVFIFSLSLLKKGKHIASDFAFRRPFALSTIPFKNVLKALMLFPL